MTYADRLLDALTDEYCTGPDIARDIGIPPCKASLKLRVLEKYHLVERGEDVRASNGCLVATWRRVQ